MTDDNRHEDGLPSLEDILLQAACRALKEKEIMRELEEGGVQPSEAAYMKFQKKLKHVKRTRCRHALRMVAVSAILVVLLVGIACGVVWRMAELHLTENGEYAEIEVGEKKSSDAVDKLDWSGYYLPTYLPSGYVAVDCESVKSRRVITYKKENKGTMYFYQVRDANATTNIDNEVDKGTSVDIHNQKGYLSKKGATIMLYWAQRDTDGDLLCSLESAFLTEKELIRVAESTTKQE